MRSIWLSYEVVSIDDEGNVEFREGSGDETMSVGHDAFLPDSPALCNVGEWLAESEWNAGLLAHWLKGAELQLIHLQQLEGVEDAKSGERVKLRALIDALGAVPHD